MTRQLGLWGSEVDYYVPNALPGLPARVVDGSDIEARALRNRVDLAITKLELQALAQAYGMTNATRFVSDFELIAGAETERENDGGSLQSDTKPQLELEFAIPIFDSGKARMKKAEASYMIAAHDLAQRAVNVRSEARSAHAAHVGSHRIARHYRDAVLPLRKTIEDEALLSYNGMITSTFELLADTRARMNSTLTEAQARRDFWLADANLMAAIYGGGSASSGRDGRANIANESAAGH